ncbi:MAG: tRNA (uracil-5-)-methyltransferase [Lachnospiraceae bacterium]|nr:tRNA (uracil-5-)-methyltransferase [Lachnospiraceae bacterium]
MKKAAKIILIAAVALLLAGGGMFAGMNWNNWFGKQEEPQTTAEAELDTGAEDWTGERSVYTGEKNTDTIDIPGYGSITLKADDAKQTVNFYNPEQNTCYFRISLLLSDRTEVWQSGLVEPGKGIYSITLKETLPAGEYEDAVLKYECFAMNDEQTPLNGSEIKLTLNVIK